MAPTCPPAPALPPRLWVIALLMLPWVQPWAPGPQSNTLPLLIAWCCFLLVLVVGKWPHVHELARAWACAALLSSAIGLIQYAGLASEFGGWLHAPGVLGEAQGSLRQRNQLATLTSMGAVAVLWWHAQGLRRPHALWMLALLAAGNAATASRTGLWQWLLLPLLALLWQARDQHKHAPWARPLLAWALACYALAAWALPVMLAHMHGLEVSNAMVRMGHQHGCASRLVLWDNVLQLIAHRPWTGWGWGELKYAHYMAHYTGPRFCDVLGNAHNLPLHLAFVWGVPATLALLTVVALALWHARPWHLQRVQDSLAWGVLAVIGLHSLLEFPLWYGPFQIATLLCVGLLWRSTTHLWLGVSSLARVGVRLLAGVGLLLGLWIGLDYECVRQVYLPPAQRWSMWQGDPWGVARQTVLFKDALRFAEVTSTLVTASNAPAMLHTSLGLLHYSPEPRVIDKLVESAHLTGQTELAQWHTQQKRQAYPPPAQ